MTVGCNGLLGPAPGRSLPDVRTVEVRDVPAVRRVFDYESAPGSDRTGAGVERYDGYASKGLDVHALRDEMHVLGT